MILDPPFTAQYAALTRGAGFAALADRTLIAIRGADRVALLNGFCTNHIKALQPGGGCEAFITNPQGKTLGHVLVYSEPEQLVIDTAPGQAATLITHLDRYVISEDVQFADRSAEECIILVAGKTAAETLARLASVELPAEPLSHRATIIAGRRVSIRRTEYAGPSSFFVQTEASARPAIEQALAAAGAVPCESAAVEAARLEAGFPLFGRDITDENLPQEIGRDARAISFTKGCYLGQETIARIDALGHVNRLLVGAQFVGDSMPAAGTQLLVGDKEVGHVTSAAWSPALGAPLALALIRRASAKPGTQLASAAGPAQVIALPVALAS
jgi:tRNA-modifying protein YgfZ